MKPSNSLRSVAAATIVAALLVTAAGCGGDDSGKKAAVQLTEVRPNDDYTQGAEEPTGPPAQAPAPKRVGESVDVGGGLKVTLLRIRAVPRRVLDPVTFDKPASWRGLHIVFRTYNGTGRPLKLDPSEYQATSDPNTASGIGANDERGALGDGTLLPGRTRDHTLRHMLPSTSGIVVDLTVDADPSPPQPFTPVTWAGDAH
ncbi:hypothetical protein [Actinomadura yumaensis]|uniref:DUF4352 domain-containing protein n=1 Tax=Actinomadura yumaensis TaxID=111807 RepID=A0ABW2CNZ3_9ACTN